MTVGSERGILYKVYLKLFWINIKLSGFDLFVSKIEFRKSINEKFYFGPIRKFSSCIFTIQISYVSYIYNAVILSWIINNLQLNICSPIYSMI
jgi:hypothetical protein